MDYCSFLEDKCWMETGFQGESGSSVGVGGLPAHLLVVQGTQDSVGVGESGSAH